MGILKNVFAFMAVSTLIVGGVLIGGTIVAAKGIDKAGDELQKKRFIKNIFKRRC
ncbi:hypothetical protein [Companilactobacillus sp.]|uniref:hypothetical protein n=1 Tax=Companilactobacillus sp. TaxID=2767905 RepID=UPI002604EEAB|nr:hypothetical protein [Companilactobacillus sp.]